MEYIDLSQDIASSMPVYPGDIEVSLEQVKDLVKDEYNAYSLFSGLHAGTHIDCPMHLLQSVKTIAEYPVESFIGSGILIDSYGEKEISMKEEYKKRINKGDIVLIYTGMGEKYGSENYYLNHPVITKELAKLFVEKEIKMVGIDMPSPDYPPFEIHKLLLGQDIFIMENMANLKQLIGIDRFEVFALPLKLQAEASLVRAFARCY